MTLSLYLKDVRTHVWFSLDSTHFDSHFIPKTLGLIGGSGNPEPWTPLPPASKPNMSGLLNNMMATQVKKRVASLRPVAGLLMTECNHKM